MIIVKSPLRISFFGGGTDFPKFYNTNKDGGAVIAAAINKYNFINIRELENFFNHKYRLRYYINEEINKISHIRHPVIKTILSKYLNNKKGYEIIHNSDLPARSGLGSSSSFTNALLKAVYAQLNLNIKKTDLWKKSLKIEQSIEKDGVGSQDQIITALGGVKFIKFKRDGVIIKNMKNLKNINFFKDRCSLFFTGFTRSASKIEKGKINLLKKNYSLYQDLLSICLEAFKNFENSKDISILNMSELLKEQWKIKKSLSNNVSNKNIDELYHYGLKNGAVAGKILGAGGGGFFMFLSKDKNQKKKLIKSIKSINLIDFDFDKEGSQILYRS